MKKEIEERALSYDVVIVGAGAAGCMLAGELSPSINALLVDYRIMPRKKACSGILVKDSQDIIAHLAPPANIFFTPKKFDIVYLDMANHLEKPVGKAFWNTSRKKLDQWLYSRLEKKQSIVILDKTKLVDFFPTESGNSLIVTLDAGGHTMKAKTNYLVGCDGALSAIRKKISSHTIPSYLAIQENILGKPIKNAYFIFDDEITDFYGWVIPKGKLVEVGVAVSPQNSKAKFESFKNRIAERFGLSGKGEVDSAIVLRPISMNEIILGQGHVLLCGEAAGLIDPSSAEGISYALRSAKFCADALNKNFDNALEQYKKNCSPLLDRLAKKFEKSAVISDKEKRKKLFE